jgi:hypothetical protein
MVGRNPFKHGGIARIKTLVIPVVIVINTVGTTYDPTSRTIGTSLGTTTFDPTVAVDNCMKTPNDIPLAVFQESPLFNSVETDSGSFDFGGTTVARDQYVDAFQRGNFWQVINEGREDYHTLLSPVEVLPTMMVNVPAAYGTTLPSTAFPSCSSSGVVDFGWFRNQLVGTLLPQLAPQDVSPANFPIFLVHNVVLADTVTDFNTCCTGGFHSSTGASPIQTYSFVNFNSTGIFPKDTDTVAGSHEIAEWMNDPFGNNRVPSWGHIGQQKNCQGNLEVGDPINAVSAPPIVMRNGFTYHLQELTFLSWFFGGPSSGIHGWYSNNGSFLGFQAAICQQ